MAKNIKPLHVELDRTWTATGAWMSKSKGPIVLVKLESGTGEVRNSRFDLHKAAFIDPVPETGGSGIPKLAESITALSRPSSVSRKSKAPLPE